MKRWEWKFIKGKAHHHEIFLWQTQGQFCPTTQPQKQGHTNTSWSAQAGMLGSSLYTGKGRCVCMLGITEHVPQKTQKREALQKASHLPHPKWILSLSSLGHWSREIQQIQVSKELRQTQSQPHRRLPWDSGVTLGYQLSSPELRDQGISPSPYFHWLPKGPGHAIPSSHPSSPGVTFPGKTGVLGSAAEGRPQGAATLHRE